MAVIGYARISSSSQDLGIQLGSLAHCDEIFSEVESGAKKDRPKLLELLRFIRKGDVVECTRLDRLARDTHHLLEIVQLLERKNVALKIQNINLDTSTATGKLMLTMLAAISAFERDLLKERQQEGIEKAKREGVYKGRKPTARAKSQLVLELVAQGVSKVDAAKRTGISVPSVYRILGAATQSSSTT
ncbi:recombinase family protein [Candidatus Magnetaquicoccus inordinatus]|uniref:recombinase family protein n=1 Tax=Candidatus Magnetaquicoccus inordinatus TaxID=2496818 RepID=UPI00102C3019|nr:recombinase family protein [Candidatus Magnetaquicoccus inordinatus]